MGGTWSAIANEILGYVPQKKTPLVEKYVAVKKIQSLLRIGWTVEEVALIWNTSLAGIEKPLRIAGVNKQGVAYDSPAYAAKVVHAYKYLVD